MRAKDEGGHVVSSGPTSFVSKSLYPSSCEDTCGPFGARGIVPTLGTTPSPKRARREHGPRGRVPWIPAIHAEDVCLR